MTPPRARLAVTPLEDRTVPALFGTTWVDTNLTASFVPDGTDVAGAPSTLFASLGQGMTAAEWQGVVREAFQVWVGAANLNVGFVADDGRPLGSPAPVQGGGGVGDIRVSARPLSANVYAIANPPDLVSPWAGEIILNSTYQFGTRPSGSAIDLRTVVLHEIGHALGLPANTTDPDSVMTEYSGTKRTALSAADVAAVQALYGARPADRYEGTQGNDTTDRATALRFINTAAALTGIDPTADATRYVAVGDVRSADDVDVFKVTLPKAAVTVIAETRGLSQAGLRVDVLDAGGKVVASTSTYAAAAGGYKLTFTPKAAGDFFVRVRAASGKAVDVGAYRLAVGSGLAAVPTSTLSTRIQNQYFGFDASPDWANGGPGNDTFDRPLWLGFDGGDRVARWDFTGAAGIDVAADADVYAVTTGAQAGRTLVVAAWADAGGPAPVVRVYDADHQLVSAGTLVRDGNTTAVQVSGLAAWKTYYVVMTGADPAGWAGRQAYRFGIDFRAAAVSLDTLATGTLTAAAPQVGGALEVTRSQGFYFQLAATGAAGSGAKLTVLDAAGTAVFTLTAAAGETAVGKVLLDPGAYTVVVTGGTFDGSPLGSVGFTATYLPTTDPVGPELSDGFGSLTTTTTTTSGSTDALRTTDGTECYSYPPADGYVWLSPYSATTGFLAPTGDYGLIWW